MKNLSILSLLFIALFTVSSAQDESKWYLAYREAQQQVIAYDLSGSVNVLLEDVQPINAKRINADISVIVVQENNDFVTYIVTSDQAYFLSELNLDYDPAHDFPPERLEAVELVYPHILIWNHEYTLPILFNQETKVVEKLSLEAWETVRISEDGRYLRYHVRHSQANDANIGWALVEYDIYSRDSRQFYSRSAEFRNERCRPDDYGEKWFCNWYSFITDPPDADNLIVHINGHIEAVPNTEFLKIGLEGEWYFLLSESYGDFCEVCQFTVWNYSTGERHTYDLAEVEKPTNVSFALNWSEILSDEYILLYDTHGEVTFYLLQNEEKITYLGVNPCCGGGLQTRSSDGMWQIVFDLQDDNADVHLIALPSGETILYEVDIMDSFGFREHGVFLPNFYYSFEELQSFRLEEQLIPYQIIDISPGHVIADIQEYDSQTWQPGIYLIYESGEKELIVPDAESFWIEWKSSP